MIKNCHIEGHKHNKSREPEGDGYQWKVACQRKNWEKGQEPSKPPLIKTGKVLSKKRLQFTSGTRTGLAFVFGNIRKCEKRRDGQKEIHASNKDESDKENIFGLGLDLSSYNAWKM
jgi:hypothetical protein